MSTARDDSSFALLGRRTSLQKARRTKISLACNYCRNKKIKCGNGDSPCTNCIDQRATCSYPIEHRQRNRFNRRDSRDSRDVETRLALLETLLPTAVVPPLSNVQRMHGSSSEHDSVVPQLAAEDARLEPSIAMKETNQDQDILNPPAPLEFRQLFLSAASPEPTEQHHSIFSGTMDISGDRDDDMRLPSDEGSKHEDDGSSSLPPEEEISYEYHGPGSYISICSKSGVQWVQEKTGSVAFEKLSRDLTSSISRLLKLEEPINSTIQPEPADQLAFEYTRAYFEDCPESTFGLVRRETFEARLRSHFDQVISSAPEHEPAWYALRMVIYAFGYRAIHARDNPRNFSWTQGPGWQYFQNSLSVHSQILFSKSGLMAVQALAMMSFYVEGLGTPALDYILCSSAMKLAESKGLHRQPATAWKLSESDVDTRSRVWWAIYEYERHIAYRSGRPLAIDDDNITCQFPSQVYERDNFNLHMFASLIKHAQISSRIIKITTKLKISTPTLEEVVQNMVTLERDLQAWRDSLPSFISFETQAELSNIPPNVHKQHVHYQLYSYYGSLIAIHSVLVHPWNRVSLRVDVEQKDELKWQIAKSGEIVAAASRSMIELLKHVHIDAKTPKCLAFSFPMTALFNLFTYVLQHPSLPSAEKDLELMHIAAGHFNYVEFMCPQMSFSLTRDLANLARLAMIKAKERNNQDDVATATPNYDAPLHHDDTRNEMSITPLDESVVFPAMDIQDEEWCTLLEWPTGTISLEDVLQEPDHPASSNTIGS